jgi:methyl-accepting chemotaxis protein
MDQTIQILSIVALGAFIILAFVLTSSIKSFLSSLDLRIGQMQKDMGKMEERLTKSLDGIDKMTEETTISLSESREPIKNIGDLAKNINDQVDDIGKVVRPFAGLADDFYKKIERPILNTGIVISAVQKAMLAFLSKMGK